MKSAAGETPWLIVGLGNPGQKYAHTRHNVGQMVLDEFAAQARSKFKAAKRGQAVLVEGRLDGSGSIPGPRVILAKTTTYMNISGGPVAAVAQFYGIPEDRIIVVHDELDIPFGKLKLKRGGGDGGHNGLKDITKALGTKNYLRIRVGIGRPPGRQEPAEYVLKGFSAAESKEVPFLIGVAIDAAEMMISDSLEAAQTKFHALV